MFDIDPRLHVRVADQLKSMKKFDEAEKSYLEAMEADPTWSYPPYQLACNYALSNQHDNAVKVFKQAMDLGFADFPTALEDDELGELRNGPDFKKTLGTIRERYIADGINRVGTPIGVKPDGERPKDGWPVMLLLHGYGDTNVNYVDMAKEWSNLGFVAVAVPGSVPGLGMFMWDMKSTEPTLDDLRAIVKSELLDGVVNRQKVFLLGFSQGALHSLLLTAEHPDEFAGVVALSPGGSLSKQMIVPKIADGRDCRLVFIYGDQEPHAPIASRWKAACKESRWRFMSNSHPGGHHFPRDWENQQALIANFPVD